MLRKVLATLASAGILVGAVALAVHAGGKVPGVCTPPSGHDVAFESCGKAPADLIREAAKSQVFRDAVLNYGLDVRGAVHLTKTGFDYSVVVVPQSEEARDKTKGLAQLVIHLNPDTSIRRIAVQQVTKRDDGNVELSFRSGDGHRIMGAVYTADLELVEVLGSEGEGGPATIQHSPLPHDSECWRRCMLNEWNNLPDWIRAICGPICGGCLGNRFSGGACYYCSFCLAFYGGWCAGQC